jgi:hypothetical protein
VFYAAKDRAGSIALVAGIILILTGCNSMGAGKQLKQLELENNRLLSEFRAERQRRESAERTAQRLETLLAESEKTLARQLQGPPGAGRLSSLPLSPSGTGLSGLNSLPSTGPASGNVAGSGSATDSGLWPNGSPVGSDGKLSPGSADLRWHRRN